MDPILRFKQETESGMYDNVLESDYNELLSAYVNCSKIIFDDKVNYSVDARSTMYRLLLYIPEMLMCLRDLMAYKDKSDQLDLCKSNLKTMHDTIMANADKTADKIADYVYDEVVES